VWYLIRKQEDIMYLKVKHICQNCGYELTLESDVKINKITICPNCGHKKEA